MRIGIPKEIAVGERRVAVVPDTVARLVASGMEVFVESSAGEEANFTDEMYGEAGATLSPDAASLLGGAEVILKGTKVDGVYDSDPNTNEDAKFYERLTYLEVLEKGLKVMDATAISLCMDHNLPIIVFSLRQEGNIRAAVLGKKIGSIISQ